MFLGEHGAGNVTVINMVYGPPAGLVGHTHRVSLVRLNVDTGLNSVLIAVCLYTYLNLSLASHYLIISARHSAPFLV